MIKMCVNWLYLGYHSLQAATNLIRKDKNMKIEAVAVEDSRFTPFELAFDLIRRSVLR